MVERQKEKRMDAEIVCLEDLMPRHHLLRKIDKAIDWNKVYGICEKYYCADNGRASVDPVVLVKMLLLQHIYGLPSMRRTAEEAQVNITYRWFLGYGMSGSTPHFSTVSYAFAKRFPSEVFEEIFTLVLEEGVQSGYVKPRMIFVDSTHIKANANRKKQMKKYIPAAVKQYEELLHREINEDRIAHGKKPFTFDGQDDDEDRPTGGAGATRQVTVSRTDPDSGLFHKGEHQKCFAYSAHTACDANNFVLDVEVSAGNIHDSRAFDGIYERVTKRFSEVETLVMDAGYRTPWIAKRIFDDGRIPCLPYKRPMTKKGNLPWYEYVYDEYNDIVICPAYQTLAYSTTNREGYREYKSKPYICQACEKREQCTQSKSMQKLVTQHIWWEYMERVEDIRLSPFGKAAYALRSQTIERVFADAKEKHGMRYTLHRGLTRVSNWVRLKFAAMNLKKLALWKFKEPKFAC